ncbi:hypothetical protein BN1058_00915 [Paraliobacillus sp. PM-2]|uniref:DUF72 domain-containing protein n=1 Tax=Paraliobacillus sp. PM-2 TaxID=1462524 RepID=UPI00061BECC1|nr:DUF72 domain-containing protein [Paraliobacillus sp. PM-2]CQR46646.1 hypothetical protein BN1058_00915 [Paraliobacillus sp. PM-2]
MSIFVGLTGWGDHDLLYHHGIKAKEKLATYSAHFPIVEVDSSFYAIQPIQNVEKWCAETPANFKFIFKAHQSMTGHDRKKLTNYQAKQVFQSFIESIEPVRQQNKLLYILFQFPPWFDVREQHITKLKKIKQLLPSLPIAIEFRHQSWFHPKNKDDTLALLRTYQWINTICDEPQAGDTSIPTIVETTNKTHAFIRMHGRNLHGWNRNGRGEEWRKVRFLYRYNEKELLEWCENIQRLQSKVNHVSIVFNNNSGGDASENAKQLIQLLGITYDNLNPKQLDLFE